MGSSLTSTRVLLVEDDEVLGGAVTALLAGAGHQVRWAKDLEHARQAVDEVTPELVILDLGLPDGDGLTLCHELREVSSEAVVVVLSADSDETAAIRALDGGADDFVAKPFRAGELIARIGAHLRRRPDSEREVNAGPLRLNLQTRSAWVLGQPLELRRKEFDLLAALASRADVVVRREDLIEEVWGFDWSASTKTLDVHIAAIRRKLADSGDVWERIATVRGYGYRFDQSL